MSQLQEVMALIAYAPPRLSAPAKLRAKILEAAERPSATRRWGLPLSGWQWCRVTVAALALLVVGLGLDNYFLRQKQTLMQAVITALQESETRVFVLRGTKAVSTASGSVLLDFENGRILIALQNLPPLPSQETYYLWAFIKNQKILCGKFNTSPSGQVFAKIPLPIWEYTSPVKFMQISKESATTPPAPRQIVLIMTSEL